MLKNSSMFHRTIHQDAHITKGLLKSKNGIWVKEKPEAATQISYPTDGNAYCVDVEENSFWFRHRQHALLTLLHRYKPPDTFLDIGGGTGAFCMLLQKHQIPCMLLEPDAWGASCAKNRGVHTVIQSSFQEVHTAPDSLGAIGLFDVLEHIEHEGNFLQKLHRSLYEGGRLYMTVPTCAWLWSDEDVHSGHYRRYSLHQLCTKLSDAGWEVEYASYLFLTLLLPIFVVRTMPSILGFSMWRKRKHYVVESRFLNRCLQWELSRIGHNKRIPYGSSAIIIARKKSHKHSIESARI